MRPIEEPEGEMPAGVAGGDADMTAERIARNDSLFREANEELRRQAARHGFDPQGVPFICECADPGCTEVFLLDLGTYARVRSNPRWFVTVPRHEESTHEMAEIVERNDGYAIVEKIGRAGEVAEQLVHAPPEAME